MRSYGALGSVRVALGALLLVAPAGSLGSAVLCEPLILFQLLHCLVKASALDIQVAGCRAEACVSNGKATARVSLFPSKCLRWTTG